jgi:hypothetical protein
VAGGINIPFSVNIKLLNIAERYCKIDICPNLNCRFAEPIIKLYSFNILINGR